MTADLIEYLRGVAENTNLPQHMRDRLSEAAEAIDDYSSACENSAVDLRARDARIAELEDQIEAARAYAAGNPLGGPAKRFEIMASRIRAGEPENSVLADYGLCRATELEGALEAAREAVPSNWCDPALTGPSAVIGKPPYGCPDIERLLLEVRRRILAPSIARGKGGGDD